MVDVIFGGAVLAASCLVAMLAFDAIESTFGWILRDFQPPAGRSARAALFASTRLSTLLVIGFLGRFGHYALLVILLGRFGHYALLLILLGPPLPNALRLNRLSRRRGGHGYVHRVGRAALPRGARRQHGASRGPLDRARDLRLTQLRGSRRPRTTFGLSCALQAPGARSDAA